MSFVHHSRTAIVTGGASGIGAAIVHRLTSDGYHVSVRDIAPAEDGQSYQVDVTHREQVDAAVADIRSRFGPVTIFVNAAGAEGFSRFLDIALTESPARSSASTVDATHSRPIVANGDLIGLSVDQRATDRNRSDMFLERYSRLAGGANLT